MNSSNTPIYIIIRLMTTSLHLSIIEIMSLHRIEDNSRVARFYTKVSKLPPVIQVLTINEFADFANKQHIAGAEPQAALREVIEHFAIFTPNNPDWWYRFITRYYRIPQIDEAIKTWLRAPLKHG